MSSRTIEIIINAVNKASPAIEGVGGSLQNLGKVALAGVAGVATATAAIGAALTKLAVDAAPMEGVSRAFEGLAESSGVGMDEMLAALKRGSAGMISNRDLMTSFNKAAQLVSTDFAVQLPNAMGYLGKVAAATGQDMNFMLDSLVTGVGRLSPMILDNLGIQVSLTEANEAYAASIGKSASELTKSEQQAALMNQVMEKLAVNTASMPDITTNAAATMAQLRATFQNVRDELGVALLPVLNTLMGAFGELANAVLPVLVQLFEEHLAPALQNAVTFIAPLVEALAHWISLVAGGADPLLAFQYIVRDLVPPELYATIKELTDGVREFIEQAQIALEPVLAWLGENIKLQDVLIALGVAIATVVVPALATIVAGAAPVIATFLAAVAIVAALRAAWESDFLGIQTFTLAAFEFIKRIVSTALVAIAAWWSEHGAAITAKAKEIWDGVVKVFEFFKQQWQTLFEAFALAFEGDWRGFGEKLREWWDAAWKAIAEVGAKAWQGIKDFFTNTDWGAVGRAILEGIANGITAGLEIIKTAASNAAKAALDAAKGFLGIESPSKLFADVGANISAGMAEGITRNLSPVISAGGALGSAAYGATGATYNYARTVNLTMQPTQYRTTGVALEDDLRWAATIMGLA